MKNTWGWTWTLDDYCYHLLSSVSCDGYWEFEKIDTYWEKISIEDHSRKGPDLDSVQISENLNLILSCRTSCLQPLVTAHWISHHIRFLMYMLPLPAGLKTISWHTMHHSITQIVIIDMISIFSFGRHSTNYCQQILYLDRKSVV